MESQPMNLPHSPAKLEIEYKSLASDTYEVRLVGELGMGSVSSLDRVLKKIFEEKVYKIIMNLEATHYIASSGIGILLAASETARKNGGDFIMAGTNPRVKHVFELMGLASSIHFASSVKEGLKLLKRSA